MWQETYVKYKSYWSSGTAELSPISANFEKFAMFAILLKLYINSDFVVLILLPIAILIWNIGKLLIGWWRDHSLLWHYEAEFSNSRNPTLKRIEDAVVKK